MRTSLLWLMLLGCTSVASPQPSVAAIEWREWGPEVFAEAQASGRLVFVNGSIEGCMACRWMEATTYRDPRVRERFARSFVAVTIDADARPDIGQRFERWGWPALVFLSPEGRVVHAIRGNKQPRNFLPILDALIARHAEGTLGSGTPLHVTDAGEPTDLENACRRTKQAMDARGNPAHGGWGRQTIVRGAPVAYAFLRHRGRGETRALPLTTSEAYAGLLDPVWGGAYLETTDPAWTEILYEKRTRQEAETMTSFLRAYQVTEDPLWLERTEAVARHLREWMRRPDGPFFTYQEDQAPGWRGSVAEYYALPDAERRAAGLPPIDRAVYTDVNGDAIEAFARFAEVSGDERAQATAIQAAEALIEERWQPDGWMLHVLPSAETEDDARMVRLVADRRMHLRSQARFGTAVLALARLTGDRMWIDRALQLARAMETLWDEGGYFSSPGDGTESILGRERSLRENAVAARFLLELSVYVHDEVWEARAVSMLEAMIPANLEDTPMHALGELALSIERAALGPVQFTIVGEPADESSQDLYEAALRTREPYKTVQFQVNGQYPEADHPVAYICTRSTCSRPLADPSAIAEVADRFRQAESVCGSR
ncbi:MAG: DUF255 domain-containing protein [Myxococcota bacterium]